MLTGGDDLDPKKMGLTPHPSVTVVPERRELADRLLCKMVQQRQNARAGHRVGHAGTERRRRRRACSSIFRKTCPSRFPTATRTGERIGTPSSCSRALGSKQFTGPARSASTPITTRASASSRRSSAWRRSPPTDLIEGFEGKDHSWWVTGVQWHPENEGNISLDMQLIEAFVAAAASSKSVPALAKVG